MGRVEKLHDMLVSLKAKRSVSLHESQALHGLLRFASGFVAGRQLHQVCAETIALCRGGTLRSPKLVEQVCDYADLVLKACRPRVLNTNFERQSILCFTDGSWEDPFAGVGAVVLDTLTGWRAIYSGELPLPLYKKWLMEVDSQLICQIELYAVAAICFHLSELLHNRRFIWWVDNEAARFSLIKGLSASPTMRSLTRAFYSLEVSRATFNWFERVPSISDVADAPSRARASEIFGLLDLSSHEPFPTPKDLMRQLL